MVSSLSSLITDLYIYIYIKKIVTLIQNHCLITIFIHNGPVKYFNKNTRILA